MTPKPKKQKTQQDRFVPKYVEYYKWLFVTTADSVEMLADIQRDFKKEYEAIREFPSNPTSIEGLIATLKPDMQAKLLRLLLNAGMLARRIADLLILTETEKRVLAKDLKNLARDIK